MSIISKTVITFTVLHRTDEPFNPHWTLQDAMARSLDGNAVGWETDTITEEVGDFEVEDELVKLGNDGSFFDTDLEYGATCDRHGGTWGDDKTCPRCTYENGGVRGWDDKGPFA